MAVRHTGPAAAHETRNGGEAPPGEAKPARGGGWFTTVCAVVALAAGVVGLFWDLLPQYRPDPLDTVGADIEVAAVEPNVSLQQFLRRTRGDELDAAARDIFGRVPSPSELRQPGELLYVRTQVDGHKHRDIVLSYALYNRATQKRVQLPLPSALARLQRARLEAPSQRSVQLLWLPDLSAEPGVFVRVLLTSDRGLLAIADSRPLVKGLPRN